MNFIASTVQQCPRVLPSSTPEFFPKSPCLSTFYLFLKILPPSGGFTSRPHHTGISPAHSSSEILCYLPSAPPHLTLRRLPRTVTLSQIPPPNGKLLCWGGRRYLLEAQKVGSWCLRSEGNEIPRLPFWFYPLLNLQDIVSGTTCTLKKEPDHRNV